MYRVQCTLYRTWLYIRLLFYECGHANLPELSVLLPRRWGFISFFVGMQRWPQAPILTTTVVEAIDGAVGLGATAANCQFCLGKQPNFASWFFFTVDTLPLIVLRSCLCAGRLTFRQRGDSSSLCSTTASAQTTLQAGRIWVMAN